MDNENKALTVLEDFNSNISYCSLNSNTRSDQILLYNVINSPDHKLSDYVGKTIDVKDFVMDKVSLVSDKTGEVSDCPRCVLIDKNNESYVCTSFGMRSALAKLCLAFGYPTWDEPITVEIQNVTTSHGKKVLTLKAM